MKKLFGAILESLEAAEPAVLVSITASSGSTPRGAGAMMAVLPGGRSLGTIGGGAVEFAAQKHAAALFADKTSGAMRYRLRPNDVADLGMICGGDVSVYFQYVEPTDANRELFAALTAAAGAKRSSWLVRRVEGDELTQIGIYDGGLRFIDAAFEQEITPFLKKDPVFTETGWRIEPIAFGSRTYIFGGGHVSQEVCPVLAHLGFAVTIYEDREEFTRPELFPLADEIVRGSFKEIAKNVTITADDYIVIMTRGHQADFEVLEQSLATPAPYIGCIGSRIKVAKVRARLIEAGQDEADYDRRVFSPIGLKIKAETPAEIAISVAAEMIEFRAERG